MNLVLFSGNSLHNRDWIYDVEKHVLHLFEQTYVQDYRHWQTGEPLIDIDYELASAQAKIGELNPYFIFAKSLGCALALKGIADGVFRAERCVFVGLPTLSIQQLSLAAQDWLKQVSIPITIIQNEHDPYGSYEDVQAYVGDFGIEVIKAPGDTHDYLDYEQITQLLST